MRCVHTHEDKVFQKIKPAVCFSAGGNHTEISESSSNNSDISERLQSNKMAVVAAATAAAHSQAAAAASSASPSAGNHATSAAQAAVALRQVGQPTFNFALKSIISPHPFCFCRM